MSLDRSLSEIVLLKGEEKESQKNWAIKSKKGRLFELIPEKGLADWSVDLDSPHWNQLNVESSKPPMDLFLILMGLPERHYIKHSINYDKFVYKVKDMEKNQSYLTYKVKGLEERLKKLEKVSLEDNGSKIEELKNDLETVKNSLNKAIILRSVKEDDEENKKFIKEQTYIEELKEKFEGEILAFTRQDDKLKLVAHALYDNDLMDLISDAREKNQITNQDKIFYR